MKNITQREKRAFFERDIAVNLLYIPAILLFLVFVVYPFIQGIRLSFTNWNGFSQSYEYIGFRNYVSLISDRNFYTALRNTFIYGIGSTVFQQILGLGYALLLTRKFKGQNIYRTIIYMPVLIAAVIMGYMWYFIVQYDGGALNDVLVLFGQEPIDLLAHSGKVIWLIVFINVLQFVGVSMVIYITGLTSIPKMYYEASEIDGANKVQQFIHVTIPLLMPAITTSVIYNLIGGLKLFDVVKALTNGGPGYASHSLSTYVRYIYFGNQQAGYSSTLGLVLFLIILVVSILMQRFFNRREVY